MVNGLCVEVFEFSSMKNVLRSESSCLRLFRKWKERNKRETRMISSCLFSFEGKSLII